MTSAVTNVEGDQRQVGLPDLAPTGPGTLAGRYLRLFWQPVCHAEDLQPGQTKPLHILSEDFTLYRGETGIPHVLAPRCAHRGTQLSTGWVEGDCLRCFYHGWKYDGTGQCVEMPAEDPGFPPRVRIRSYPTREYLGLVFAYLGEGEPPPLPQYPEYEDGEVILEYDPYWRRCNYFQNIENGFDTTHLGFVHRYAPAAYDGLALGTPVVAAEETEWGIAVTATHPAGWRSRTLVGMPNVYNAIIFTVDPVVRRVESILWRVPIDDEEHVVFHIKRVPLPEAEAEAYRERLAARRARLDQDQVELTQQILEGKLRLQDVARDRTDITRLEDGIAQEGQGRIVDREAERLGRGDVAIILLRKVWLRELQALADGRPLKQWTRPATLRPERVG